MNSDVAVVLAAGKGTRMGGELPKVLVPMCDRPLVHYVVDCAHQAGIESVVAVVGYRADLVEASLSQTYGDKVRFALQKEQRGTGDAVKAALPSLPAGTDRVWILSGDVPRLRPNTLEVLGKACAESPAGLSFATFIPPDAGAYGRILRDEAGKVQEIREARDCSPAQLEVKECNAGIYCAKAENLEKWLPQLSTENDQGEYYLTDIVALALASGEVQGIEVPAHEVAGINTRDELAAMEAAVLAEQK